MADAAQQDGLAHLRGDIADLTASVDTLSQGLRLMLETQETHTEMLTALLKAAAKPDEESALEILLARIVAGLEVQTESLGRLGGRHRPHGPGCRRRGHPRHAAGARGRRGRG